MFEYTIKVLGGELTKLGVSNPCPHCGNRDRLNELRKAIKVLREGTGYIAPHNGEDGEGKVRHFRFDEL